RFVPGSRPAKGFGTDCVKKLEFWCACANCCTVGTFKLRAVPAWLSLVLTSLVRLPTNDASTTMLPGSWCCTPREYECTNGIERFGLLKMMSRPANVSRPADAPVGASKPPGNGLLRVPDGIKAFMPPPVVAMNGVSAAKPAEPPYMASGR